MLLYSPSASPELQSACVGWLTQNLVAPSAMSGRQITLVMHITATAAILQFIAAMLSYAMDTHSSSSESFSVDIIFFYVAFCCLMELWAKKTPSCLARRSMTHVLEIQQGATGA
jgi:hypothetical protein